MMKTKCIPLVAAISAFCLICGCSQTNSKTSDNLSQESSGTEQTQRFNAVELVSDIATTQFFTVETVNDDDIETILMAGINAPSATTRNPLDEVVTYIEGR